MKGYRYIPPWRKVCLIAAFVLSVLYANAADVGTAQAQQENDPDATSATSATGETIGQIYIVQPRDSLTKIARNVFGGSVSANEIYDATNAKAASDPSFSWIANPNVIVAGQKLWVPATLAVDATEEITAEEITAAEIAAREAAEKNAAAGGSESAAGGSESAAGGSESAAGGSESAAAVAEAPISIPTVTPELRIADQKPSADNVIVVDAVTVGEPGTLYITSDATGAPHSILGQVPLAAGESQGVQVALSQTVPFGTELFASLVTTVAPDGPVSDNPVGAESSTALLPPSPVATTSFRVGLSAGELATQDILTILNSTDEFSVLNSALQTAGLVEGLRGGGPFTLYMPTNAAFSRLSEAQLELLLTDMVALEDVLRYHIVPGGIESSNLQGTRDMPTLSGGVLTLRRETEGLFVGDAGVLFADVRATNGVIYAIDQVLLPPIFHERLAAGEAATSAPGVN